MTTSDQERERIRAYVARNFEKERRERRAVVRVMNLIMPLILLVIGWAVGGGSQVAGMILVSIGLGLAMLFGFIGSWMESEAGQRDLKRDLVIEARKKQQMGLLDVDDILDDVEPQKAKRDETVRLSDDGELVSDELIEESERRARGAVQ